MIRHVYCDESGEQNRFMAISGIVIPEDSITLFNDTMMKYRTETGLSAELKWTKVHKNKLQEYKRFVDYFFALNNTDKIHFRALVVDTHKLDHKKFSGGDKELGFYKFYYQLLLHCFGKGYCSSIKDKFIVYLDYRTSMSKYPLSELRNILNNGMGSRYSIHSAPFISVEPRDSKDSELIQINDIILGAIGYQKNGFDLLAEPDNGKKLISEYIIEKSGFKNLTDDTPWGQKRFTIWNFKLRK